MKKFKKLLSVLLAMLMIFSCFSVMGSAAKTEYQTVSELEALGAYNTYGEVTRLSTEARTSIIFDAVDNLLAPMSVLNMGTVVDVLGLTVTINLTSIDNVCVSLDSFKSTLSNTMWKIAKAIVNFGILEDVSFSSWEKGMSRDGTDNAYILNKLLLTLADNSGVAYDVINSGELDLGLIGGMIGDLSAVEDYIGDLPGLIKGMVFGLFERWDDTAEEINMLQTNAAGNGGVESTLNWFVKSLFTNDMSITTVKANASGAITSDHTLPGDSADARVRYTISGNLLTAKTYATKSIVKAQKELGKEVTEGSYITTAVYNLVAEEINGEKTGDYVWAQLELDNSGTPKTNSDESYVYVENSNLKYYENNSPLLPSLKEDLVSGAVTIDLTTDSAMSLLYKFIPYVFDEMAPVVLNGSVKKLLATWFGATFKKIGTVENGAFVAEDSATTVPSDTFFTEAQGDYLWEWSNYKVINGTHYYRYEDQIFVADLSNTNGYFDVVNWNYNIGKGWLDEFIPAAADGATTSAKGYTSILQGLNDFAYKLINEVFASDVVTDINWTAGSNANLVSNLKKAIQTVISKEPESIFGSNYADGYYSLLMSDSNDDILTGVACMVVDLLMSQMTLPSAESLEGVKVGAILAAVVRELATQLLPSHNYDALIYSDYTTKTFLTGKDNDYWLDVILTMGTDIGVYYLKSLADMGEDTTEWAGMTAAGWADTKTYTVSDLNEINGVKPWEAKVDYIIDWALQTDTLWAWKFANLVDTDAFTVDMATIQDPWVKLDSIFNNWVSLDKIFNVSDNTTGKTNLEYGLRDKFIIALVNLDLNKIVGDGTTVGLFTIPNNSGLREADPITVVVRVLRTFLNAIANELIGTDLFDSTIFVGLDEIANQGNIATLAKTLVANLGKTYTNGLYDTLFPILNFLLGWKTSPQEYKDPTIYMSNRDGNDYTFVWTGSDNYPTIESTTLNFVNNSAGMLYKHRNSSVTDSPYTIKIKEITSDAVSNTLTFDYTVDQEVAPYETAAIAVGGTYAGDEAVTITVKYEFMGKDGNAVGGTQYATVTTFISNLYQDTNISGRQSGDEDKDYAGIDDFKAYQFTKDIYSTITEYKPSINYKAATVQIGNKTKKFGGITTDVAPTGYGAQYFSHITSQSEAGWGDKLVKDDITSVSGYLYKANSGVTSSTEFPHGAYDMGTIAVKYGSDSKVWPIDFIYYDDYNIDSFVSDYTGKNISKFSIDVNDTDAVAAYDAYNAALKNAVRLATYPFMTSSNPDTSADVDYVSVIMPQIEPAKTALKEAYEALKPYIEAAGATAVASSSILESALNTVEPGGDVPEINFQDYELYEYWDYQDLRTATRNRLKEYVTPSAPTDRLYTMDGVAITDNAYDANGNAYAELTNKVFGSASGNKLVGLKAAVETPTKEETDSYNEAVKAYVAPTYTNLGNEDLAARLIYYKQFLHAKTANKQFLAKEISAAATNYGTAATSTVYAADSYAAYIEAYNAAVAVNADSSAIASEVFQAKWDLMCAEKNLIEKTKSVKELGLLADLQAAADQAEIIFAYSQYYSPKSGVSTVDGMTDAQYAYAALIKALGYEYTNQYGDNVVLFDNCSIEYLTWDRENTSNNLKKIATCEQALRDAINLFECTITLEEDDSYTEIVDDIKYINGITPGSITSMTDLLSHVSASNDSATLEAKLSKANAFGTGAAVDINVSGVGTLSTYYVVIYGDVNGDGAVDGFDAIELGNSQSSDFSGAYAKAADTDASGSIDTQDYAAVVAAAATTQAIAQTK